MVRIFCLMPRVGTVFMWTSTVFSRRSVKNGIREFLKMVIRDVRVLS